MTATEFIQEIFSIAKVGDESAAHAWITIFDGDPKQPQDWTGFSHDPKENLRHINGSNAYYSVAAFHPDAGSRKAENRHVVLALVLDDVGTKADPKRCRELLGEPSFSVETSPDNYQWGYLPDKPLYPTDAVPLQIALKQLGLCDEFGLSSIRNVRLPAGINGKPGNDNFKVRLAEWHPELRYSLEYFQERLKVDPKASFESIRDSRTDAQLRALFPDKSGRREAMVHLAARMAARGFDADAIEADLVTLLTKPPGVTAHGKNLLKQARRIARGAVRWLREARRKETVLAAKDYEGEDDFAGTDSRIVEELKELPQNVLVLPSDYIPYTVSARLIFERLSKDLKLFVRGGRVVELVQQKRDSQSVLAIGILSTDGFRSRLEGCKRRVKSVTVSHNGSQLLLKLKRCSADQADVLLATTEAIEKLPPLELVTRSPVLIEDAGALRVLGHGYHALGGGIMVTGKGTPADVPLETAVRDLSNLLCDFQFATLADKSRAVSNLIGPCIRMGGLLFGHATINATEADRSQTGKGYLLAMQRAIYGETNAMVTKREGGVGSLDESLASALSSGAPFVTLDNLRGRVASQYLESVLTSLDDVPVRVPHRGEIYVSVRHTTFHLTSNGFEATDDLGSRSMITRLIKQPAGYPFKTYAEGGLIQHVQRNQGHYLGCVFAIVKHWHAAGKPALPTQHSFVEWIGTLDWIVQKVFKLSPLLEGHAEAVARVTNPGLSWLRGVALQVIAEGREGHELQAMALVQLSQNAELPIPGGDRARTESGDLARQVGMLMQKCFKEGDTVELDSFVVTRKTNEEYVRDQKKTVSVHRYVFRRLGADGAVVPEQAGGM